MHTTKPTSKKATIPARKQPKALLKKTKPTKTVTKQSKRKFYSTSALPSHTQPHVARFLPKVSSLELCNDIESGDNQDLFSAQLPVKTKSLQRMERFIMNLQASLVSHIEALEAELPVAESLQQGPESHDITNIPVVKKSLKGPAPKFSIERSNRDPSSGMLGGGVVAVLQGGNVFEKAGCNTSVIHGVMPVERLNNMRADHKGLKEVLQGLSDEDKAKGLPFSVAGISLVFHPHNPHHPTVHANYRLFQIHKPKNSSTALSLDEDDNDSVYWFGGGSDLTPTYIEEEGENSQYGQHFHGVLNQVMTQVQEQFPAGKLNLQSREMSSPGKNTHLYNFTKKWCDEYFYLPHRNETRGLGGIFYDDFDQHSTGLEQKELFKMVTSLGDSFASSYFPLIVANQTKPFTPEQKQFQQLRRGRYVEFNVMYDRGTKFGLQMPKTAAIRVEQILMSLPLTARYEYCHTPEPNSPEANTLKILAKPVEWVDGKM